MGFDIWLRIGKNAMKRGWEEGVRILLGMKMRIPGSVGPGDRAKVEIWTFWPFPGNASCASQGQLYI